MDLGGFIYTDKHTQDNRILEGNKSSKVTVFLKRKPWKWADCRNRKASIKFFFRSKSLRP